MLLATLLSLPWWVSVLGYFLLGVLWAGVQLPTTRRNQVNEYAAWRKRLLGPRELFEVLAVTNDLGAVDEKGPVQKYEPDSFLRIRDQDGLFTLQYFVTEVIFDVAFWPYRFIKFLVMDFFQALWRMVKKCFRAFCNLMRKIGRMLRRVYREVLVPIVNWVYTHVVSIYHYIIKLANREAIADMKKLQPTEGENK